MAIKVLEKTVEQTRGDGVLRRVVLDVDGHDVQIAQHGNGGLFVKVGDNIQMVPPEKVADHVWHRTRTIRRL